MGDVLTLPRCAYREDGPTCGALARYMMVANGESAGLRCGRHCVTPFGISPRWLEITFVQLTSADLVDLMRRV